MINLNQEEFFPILEKTKEEIMKIIGNEDINVTLLILLFIVNYDLIDQLTEEEFHEKFCKIASIIKNNKELKEIANLGQEAGSQ